MRMDPYDVGPAPAGKSWQWVNAHEIVERAATGWQPVGPDRLPGDWDILVLDGVAVVAYQGSVLVERDLELTNKAHQERVAKAEKNVDDWIAKNGGAVRIIGEDKAGRTKVLKEATINQLMRPAEAAALQRSKEQELLNGQEGSGKSDDVTGKGTSGTGREGAGEEGSGGRAGAGRDDDRSRRADGAPSAPASPRDDA